MSAAPRFTRNTVAVTVILSALLCGGAAAFENGPPPGFTGISGEPDCSTCHFDNEVNHAGGAVTLSGIPESFQPGHRYALSIVLEHDDLLTGGFQLSIQNSSGEPVGVLDSSQPDTKKLTVGGTGDIYIQHSKPRDKDDGDSNIQWAAVWTAPEHPADVTIGVSAVAANDDASAIGDFVYTTSAHLQLETVNSATADVAANTTVERRPMPDFWQQTRFNLRWAGAASNLSYITRYIAEGMLEELGRDTGYIAYGTRGNSTSENIYAVGNHEVDFALTTPPLVAALAYAGKAYFTKPYTDLRAIAVYPQNDWIVCVADAELGIDSFADIRERKLPVHVATNRIGRDNGVSFVVEQMFRAHGISPDDISTWGGSFVEVLGAGGAANKVLDGTADIGCHEYWKAFYRLTDSKAVTFLPVTEHAMEDLKHRFGFRTNTVPKDTYGSGIPAADIQAVDYSDWLVLVNANVPDDIAYVAAKVAVEQRKRGYERIYWGQNDRQRSADIPIDPKLMWRNVGVQLHPGAERYYREVGLMQ